MPTLRQLLSQHGTALVIDAASSEVQVGWIRSDGADWASRTDEAGVAVFACIEQLGVDPTGIGAHVFCDGPGSILGIRTVAMAIRTWQVLQPRMTYAYGSLALVAHALREPRTAVIADARRESWHLYRLGSSLRRVPTPELEGDLVMPEQFRHWSALPPGVRTVPYRVASLLESTAHENLFHETDAPDAFLHEAPAYATWTPQIHRAPS